MPRYRRARRTMTDIGPYFSTDAGGGIVGHLGQVATPSIPGVPPLGAPLGLPDIANLAKAAKLFEATPWAEQVSDFQWNELRLPPEFNVEAFWLGPVEDLFKTMVVDPPGFVAVSTEQPLKLSSAKALFAGTPYELFSGLAVYRQDSLDFPPRIIFLYWGQRRQVGDPDAGGTSVIDAAERVDGIALWAMDVQYGTSMPRQLPTTSFADAFAKQFGATPGGGNGKQPVPVTPVTPTPTPTKEKPSMAAPIAVGAGLALLTFLVVRGMSK